MSGGAVCKCKPREIRVIHRKCNYSAFNGYHKTPSDYSLVVCLKCGQLWRTKAKYAEGAPLSASYLLEVINDQVEIDALLLATEDIEDQAWQEGNAIIKYEIIFEDEPQQAAFFSLLRFLQTTYPTFNTLGARIKRYVEDNKLK